jgi:hypothetical protein
VRGTDGVNGRSGYDGRMGGVGRKGSSGKEGRWGYSTIVVSYRLLSGVRCVGFHVAPGVVVGGSRVLSGTAT